MADVLKWYIDVGITLEDSPQTGYIIKPIIRLLPIDDDGWDSEEEWEQERLWLVPYFKTVRSILVELRKEEYKL